jgi:hypothetical protein
MCDRLTWKGYRSGSELFYLAFPEAKHDERAWTCRARLRSNSFLKDCRCFGCVHKSSGRWVRLRTASNVKIRGHRIRFNRLDSTGAYENSLAKLLAARPIR